MTAESVWEMFDNITDDGSISLSVSNKDVKVLRISDETGDGSLTIYRILPGVYLMYNDLHLMKCVSTFQANETILAIDHSREGRIEHRTKGNKLLYTLEPGKLLMDRRVHHEGNVTLPLCHFHGITISFELGLAEESIRNAIPGLKLDITEIANRYCKTDTPVEYECSSQLEAVFAPLYQLPGKVEIDYLKIKVFEVLIFLSKWEPEENRDERQYFYRSQVEKIRAIHEFMTGNITEHHTISELSKRFDIAETALKQCFKAVYGTSIYSYMKAYKLQRAALLLVNNKEMDISEIAMQTGYSSHSKFTQAFKKQFSITPHQYRNHK